MAVPTNILVNVQTYQKAELAWLLNSFVAINISNKKFKDFDSLTANLGDTVTFDLAPRASTVNGLVIAQQETAQRQQSLICSQAVNSTSSFTDEQFIFNAEDYMDRFGESRIMEIGTVIESDMLSNVVNGVTVNNPKNPRYGQNVDPASGPYRFYGDGSTPINSFGQLAQSLANFRNYGAARNNTCAIVPDTAVPSIVNTGLNQFAMRRNDETAYDWELGFFSKCDWYESNLLPIHIAGAVGDSASPGGNVLTLVSTNDPSGLNITALTFSGASGGANAMKNGDLFQFNDGVSGLPNMRYLTFIGHKPSNQPVQVRVVGDATESGGNVTVNIFPALSSVFGLNQNLNNSLSAGMQVTVLPSHRAGIVMSGNPLYMAMPQLPDVAPFNSVATMDKESGASIRHYWGSQLGQDTRIYAWDSIWGSTLIAENTMRLIFPLTQF
jgi:hypothetical protein